MGTLHIIGAGLAGLACAVKAAKKNYPVVVYEATKRAGGRCRSFKDPSLGLELDNGSHVVLGGNPNVFKYLNLIGSLHTLVPTAQSGLIPFTDAVEGHQWSINPNQGVVPWWIFVPSRRPPSVRGRDLLFQAVTLLTTRPSNSIGDLRLKEKDSWGSFWSPVITAIMNTQPEASSAYLIRKTLTHAFFARRGSLTTYIPKKTLGQTFIEPALETLRRYKAAVHFNQPLQRIIGSPVATQLVFRKRTVPLDTGDAVILAVPPWAPVVRSFLPSIFKPKPSPVVNAHYAVQLTNHHSGNRMLGVINGRAHWVFTRPHCVSVTVSADAELARLSHAEIAQSLWQDAAMGLGLSAYPIPSHRVIVERRATPLQDPNFARSRPNMKTSLKNLFLAGDWIDTGLPSTLESAVISGFSAANAIRSIS